jgi:hypothetical protein
MNTESWAARACEGGCDFSSDMAGFAYSHDNNTALACQHLLAGCGKILIDPIGKFAHHLRLGFDHCTPKLVDFFMFHFVSWPKTDDGIRVAYIIRIGP